MVITVVEPNFVEDAMSEVMRSEPLAEVVVVPSGFVTGVVMRSLPFWLLGPVSVVVGKMLLGSVPVGLGEVAVGRPLDPFSCRVVPVVVVKPSDFAVVVPAVSGWVVVVGKPLVPFSGLNVVVVPALFGLVVVVGEPLVPFSGFNVVVVPAVFGFVVVLPDVEKGLPLVGLVALPLEFGLVVVVAPLVEPPCELEPFAVVDWGGASVRVTTVVVVGLDDEPLPLAALDVVPVVVDWPCDSSVTVDSNVHTAMRRRQRGIDGFRPYCVYVCT